MREPGLFSHKKRRLRAILSMFVNVCSGVGKKTEPDSSQQFPLKRHGAKGTN